jgi:hypothetical protein
LRTTSSISCEAGALLIASNYDEKGENLGAAVITAARRSGPAHLKQKL